MPRANNATITINDNATLSQARREAGNSVARLQTPVFVTLRYRNISRVGLIYNDSIRNGVARCMGSARDGNRLFNCLRGGNTLSVRQLRSEGITDFR